MGVRGLTTFIANRSSEYLSHYELHDSYVVIDGNSIASQLYKWHCRCNDCFGGDYDKYAEVIYSFFRILDQCNITPLIILDGAYEKRKLKTVYSRMRNKISTANILTSVSEGRVSVFPLFLREIFVDIGIKLKIQCVRCDFEGDNHSAHLARTLNCPLLSYDSDFYIFDVLYLPFSNVDLKVRRKKDYYYIACDVYRVEKFLRAFGGLDKVNLPLLAVLLGNDYIKKQTFSHFYKQLKMQKTKHNEQQTQIKSVIVWLKNETPDSALRKILGRYKMKHRKKLAGKISKAIKAYHFGNTPICKYFNIEEEKTDEDNLIEVPNPEEIENLEEEELEYDSDDDVESELVEKNDKDEEANEDTIPEYLQKIPDFFLENYRRCLYPPCFMDIITSNTYFCIQQIEDNSLEHSHSISFKILGAIAKILLSTKQNHIICLGRRYSNIKKFSVPLYENPLPELSELENLDQETAKSTLLTILNQQDNIFNLFPNSWQLFLISIKYWVSNSKNKVELPYIYSLILCAILLNYIDKKIGFYRSTKSFFSKYNNNSEPIENSKDTKSIIESLDDIDLPNSVACMKKLISYFQMEVKMKSYVRLFDRGIIHQFALFQSCLLHIKYLNSLLNFPYSNIFISEFYDGTFLYNMTTNLQKRTDLKAYMKLLLQDCPKVLKAFELIIEEIERIIDVEQHEPVKKRRKKKKIAETCIPEIIQNESDENEEEYSYDKNNKFSLLSFINK